MERRLPLLPHLIKILRASPHRLNPLGALKMKISWTAICSLLSASMLAGVQAGNSFPHSIPLKAHFYN